MISTAAIEQRQREKTHGGDLLRQVNIASDDRLSLLERALLVDVLHLLAQVFAAVDQADGAELDAQHGVGALLDLLGEVAGCFDAEGLATVEFGG